MGDRERKTQVVPGVGLLPGWLAPFSSVMVPGFVTCRMLFPWVPQLALSIPITAHMKVEEGSLTQQKYEKIQ